MDVFGGFFETFQFRRPTLSEQKWGLKLSSDGEEVEPTPSDDDRGPDQTTARDENPGRHEQDQRGSRYMRTAVTSPMRSFKNW